MATKDYFIESARLASFRSLRRVSLGANAKATKWPHKNSMPPKSFAAAGFFFDPGPDHNDTVTCYLCHKSLDGWERGDDPVAEHIKHSADCGWALTAATQAKKSEDHDCDPHSEKFRMARLMTFGQGRWPYEDSENLNIIQMVNAGFHYAPMKDNADHCLCPFCHVSVANFEPEDDPRDEHHRRAPECYFFKTENATKPAKRAPRTSNVPKGRTRRASHAKSVIDSPEAPAPIPMMETTEDEEPAPKPVRRKRTSSVKPKEAPKRATRKKTVVPDYAESSRTMSDTEDSQRGQKRPSSAISQEPVIMYDGMVDTDDESSEIVVPPKKRVTRSSMARSNELPTQAAPRRQRATRASISRNTTEPDVNLTDMEEAGDYKPRKRGIASQKSKASQPRTPALHRTYAPADGDNSQLDADIPDDIRNEPVTEHQTPFVRPLTKPLTRSRASIMVEEQSRNAPGDVLIHTGRKPKAALGDFGTPRGKTPMKPFFRDTEMDYSIPINLPKHLAQDEDPSDAPSMTEDEPMPPPQSLPKRRGRPRKNSVDPTKVEDPVPKRTRVTKNKKATATSTRSRSETVDSERPQTLETPTEEPSRTHTPVPSQPILEPIVPPKSGRKMEPTPRKREQTPDQEIEMEQQQHSPDPSEQQLMMEMAVDNNDSDSGSVVRHAILDEEGISGRNSPIASITDQELDHMEDEPSGPEGTEASEGPRGTKGTRGFTNVERVEDVEVYEESKAMETQETEANHIDDNNAPSSPFPEANRLEDSIPPSSPFLEFPNPSTLESAEQEQTQAQEPQEMEIEPEPLDLVVASAPSAPATPERPIILAPSPKKDLVLAPALAPTPKRSSPQRPRSPLSPVRRQLRLNPEGSPARMAPAPAIRTSRPFVHEDFDVAQVLSELEDEEPGLGLTEQERNMTVARWIKWNEKNAQQRLQMGAERMISMLEQKGREAREAIEAMEIA
ncbi:hypothetical protein BZA77DRAFT_298934 [Pyronema omphalodes]|nr:hypothetical protein BZA77DRAFT_298934 [Pyronema omphalodes]